MYIIKQNHFNFFNRSNSITEKTKFFVNEKIQSTAWFHHCKHLVNVFNKND